MQREKIGAVGEFQMAAIVDMGTNTIAAYEILDGIGIVRGTFSPAEKDHAFRKLRRLVSSDQGCLAKEGVCSLCEQVTNGEKTYVVRAGRKVFSYKSREKALRFFDKEVARRLHQPVACSAPTA